MIKLPKPFFLFLAFGLSACSGQTNKLHTITQPQTIRPINAEELAVKNLLSYDIYVEGDILHALFVAATANPKQAYIGYLRSIDGGQHWSTPVEIGHYIPTTLESNAGNDLQIAAHGDVLMAVWQVTGEIPGMGPLVSLFSLDGGLSWAQGSNPTASEVDQSHPDLIADQPGRFHLVWLDDRDENGYQGLRYAHSSDAGQHWELAQTLDDSSCSCCWNRLLLGTNGEVNALYRDMQPRDMALAQSSDAGQNWQRISTVGEFNWQIDGCPHNGGALAKSGEHTLHSLVWTGAEHKAGLYYLQSNDNAKSWTLPQVMGDGSLAFHSDIAALGDKRLLAIWDAGKAEGSVVMISESFDKGGHWSNAQQISTPGSSATFPRIVATTDGFLAMWSEQKPGADKQWLSATLK